jgi:hypothetical protein
MRYIIKHPNYGVYVRHSLTPRFRMKAKFDEWKYFPTRAEAQTVIREMPGMDGCTIEEKPDAVVVG